VSKPRDPKDWESWIDQAIREAQERGEFDDLPGRGKPLDLTPNPYAKEQELAFKILKDAGYAPEWIELDKAIRAKLHTSRAALARAWQRHQDRLQDLAGHSGSWAAAERQRAEANWRDAMEAFERETGRLNQQIADLNLKVPAPRFQRIKVDVLREIARVMGNED
jgi:DnaJ family protein C protein 28